MKWVIRYGKKKNSYSSKYKKEVNTKYDHSIGFYDGIKVAYVSKHDDGHMEVRVDNGDIEIERNNIGLWVRPGDY